MIARSVDGEKALSKSYHFTRVVFCTIGDISKRAYQ
jgi:hypothetical protein